MKTLRTLKTVAVIHGLLLALVVGAGTIYFAPAIIVWAINAQITSLELFAMNLLWVLAIFGLGIYILKPPQTVQ